VVLLDVAGDVGDVAGAADVAGTRPVLPLGAGADPGAGLDRRQHRVDRDVAPGGKQTSAARRVDRPGRERATAPSVGINREEAAATPDIVT